MQVVRRKMYQEFDRRIESGFQASMKEYNARLDNSFAEWRTWEEAFEETTQRNGTVIPAGFVRPTYDMGDLQGSRVNIPVSPTSEQVTYPIDYSQDVFEGWTTDSGRYIPGRPLPQIVPTEMNWGETFQEGFKNG